jgi:hypothetical protein
MSQLDNSNQLHHIHIQKQRAEEYEARQSKEELEVEVRDRRGSSIPQHRDQSTGKSSDHSANHRYQEGIVCDCH